MEKEMVDAYTPTQMAQKFMDLRIDMAGELALQFKKSRSMKVCIFLIIILVKSKISH